MTAVTKELVDSLLSYKDGKLFWKEARGRVSVGHEAGHKRSDGYILVRLLGKKYLAHRLIFLLHHGYLPDFIDHINGEKLDNRIENLREATASQNNYNTGKRSHNTSGVKGVRWRKKEERWEVRVGVDGKTKSFGFFDDLELAELVAIEARELYHGAFARHE